MKIRNGFYTTYRNLELKIFQSRSEDELPIPEEEKPFLLYCDGTPCPFSDFIKSTVNNSYYKKVYRKDLDNAYSISTFAFLKGFTFSVRETETDPDEIDICTTDKNATNIIDLRKVEISPTQYMYCARIKPQLLEKIWEERQPAFGLPMP